MRRAPAMLAALVFAAYPFLVYFGLTRFQPRAIAALLLVLFLVRLLIGLRERAGALRRPALAAGAVGLAIGVAGVVLNEQQALQLYPVVMNAALLGVFAATLYRPPSMIESFARLRHPELPPAGVAYTRKVTLAWCVFFLVNGGIAAWTVVCGSLSDWLLYNGFIAYLAMGAMVGGEILIRRART
jgi:uncharacterized membrane protein